MASIRRLGHARVDAAMEVDGDVHALAHGLADGAELLRQRVDVGEVVDVLDRRVGADLDGVKALLDALLGVGRGLLGGVAAGVAVHADLVAHAAADQLVHGAPSFLPLMSQRACSMPLMQEVRIGPPR